MLLLSLMKLKLSLFDEDLAYRFRVHTSTVTRVFHSIDVANVRLSHLIKWPDSETLRKTMPCQCVSESFSKNVASSLIALRYL